MARRKINKKQTNLIAQGGIAAIMFLFLNACVLLRRIPLTAVWGDKGNSIYASSYGIFYFVCLFSSYGLPGILLQLIRHRLKQGQYKIAGQIIRTVFFYATITGAALTVLLLFGAAYLTEHIMLEPLAVLPLQVLAGAVLLSAWNGVLRGYFLGNGAGFPVLVSMAVEQMILLAVGFPLSNMRGKYGVKAGALLQNEDFRLSFLVEGFAGGILAGTAASFLLLLSVYLVSYSYYRKKKGKDSGKGREGTGQITYLFLSHLLPALLCGLFFGGYLLVQQIIFCQLMKDSLGTGQMIRQWGIYYGKYKTFTAFPVILAGAMGFTMRDRVYACCRRENYPQMRDLIQNILQASMSVVIPFSVITGTLAAPMLETFFPGQDAETGSLLLLAGSVTAVFFSAAWLLTEVLLGIKKTGVAMFCGIGAFLLHLGALYGMLELLHLDIFGVLYADIIYAFCLLVFMGAVVQKSCGFRYGLLRGSLPPVIAAAVMGVILYLASKALAKVIPPVWLFLLGAFLGCILYFIVLLLLHGVTERQLCLIPGGKWLCIVAKAVKLL